MITINDKQYDENDFTDEQKHVLSQINYCRAKMQTAQSDFQIAQLAEKQFADALIESVESAEIPAEEPVTLDG